MMLVVEIAERLGISPELADWYIHHTIRKLWRGRLREERNKGRTAVLTLRERRILQLREQGLTMRAIAVETGWDKSTVSRSIQRIRRDFPAMLTACQQVISIRTQIPNTSRK